MEIKPIDYFPKYSVGVDGTVYGQKGKPLKPLPNGNGYFYVVLRRDGHNHNKLIHRLVAEAFLENPGNKPDVDHLDGKRDNNASHNLEWVTKAENEQRKRLANRTAHSNAPARKLSTTDIAAIKLARASGARIVDLAAQYGVTRQTVSYVVNGHTFKS